MSSLRFRAWCTKSLQWLNPEEHYLAMDGRGTIYWMKVVGNVHENPELIQR